VRQADVTDLPFEDATFTLMFSHHVQMNVADKSLFLARLMQVNVVPGHGCAVHAEQISRTGEQQGNFPQAFTRRVLEPARQYLDGVDQPEDRHFDRRSARAANPDFPVPWADRPEYSHPADRLRTAVGTSGFEIEQWNDLTDQAAALMQTLLTLLPSPIGLEAFVPDFQAKAKNLTAALADGRLRAVQGVARAV
jgi:hypothetical protein